MVTDRTMTMAELRERALNYLRRASGANIIQPEVLEQEVTVSRKQFEASGGRIIESADRLMLARAIEANVQRDRAEAAEARIAELEARLVRCGGENCMGFDASEPANPVARWVREERLQAAEARIAELEVERDREKSRADHYERMYMLDTRDSSG